MKMTQILNAFIFFSLVFFGLPAYSKDIRNETVGQTYAIAEKDALEDFQSRAKAVSPSFNPELPSANITPASKDYSYLIDPTYELQFDVPNVKDSKVVGILYPKGYRYNPLDYISADPPKLVIFNPNIKAEIAFVEKYYKYDTNSLLIITGGNAAKISNRFKRPTYYTTKDFLKKLSLKNTVSVVYRSGKHLRVDVFNAKKYVKK